MKLILIWDTGASYGFMMFRRNFIDDVKYLIPVKYATKINRVIGIGTTLHKFIKSNGNEYSSHLCSIISPKLMFDYSILKLTITCMVVILRCMIDK